MEVGGDTGFYFQVPMGDFIGIGSQFLNWLGNIPCDPIGDGKHRNNNQ